ncbi:unnamed protein product [Discula destructiva]
MGTVSIRDHIRWGRDPPSEPTDTLVLTSPARYFVDIRVLKKALPSSEETPVAGFPGLSLSLSLGNLDWAIGGTSASEARTRHDGPSFSHSVFTHWVDSRTRQPETATDEGDMFPQPDGTTLEKGRMVNPATGDESDYEELWRDGEPKHLPSVAKCTVLQLHDDAQDTRGLFVQLGQYAQGVLRVGDVFTAERWLWRQSDLKWERAFSIGREETQSLDDIIPTFRKDVIKGDKVEARSGTWTVLEAGA